MATKEVIKDYLNKCQNLQMNATYCSFTIHVYALGFEVTLSMIDKDIIKQNYFFRFKKAYSEEELKVEYELLTFSLEYYNDCIQN